MIKKRVHPESNYHSIYVGGKTLRMAIDNSKPVRELDFPEFYDIRITGKCVPGNCEFCYMNSSPDQGHAEDAVEKIRSFFGGLPETHRPFQVAIGGGEPTIHPDFILILEELDSLGIVPNYTTNGFNITEEILDATVRLCGGVAISAHAHLRDMWVPTMHRFLERGVFMAMHHIIFDQTSVDKFLEEMQEWDESVQYHVLLPMIPMGRAILSMDCDEYLFARLHELSEDKLHKVAFGALFHPYLVKHKMPVSLYDPEAFSRFLDLVNMKFYRSSFDLTEHPVPQKVA